MVDYTAEIASKQTQLVHLQKELDSVTGTAAIDELLVSSELV